MLGFFLVNFDLRHIRSKVGAFDYFDHVAVTRDLLFHRLVVDSVSHYFSFFNLVVLWVTSQKFCHVPELNFGIKRQFTGVCSFLVLLKGLRSSELLGLLVSSLEMLSRKVLKLRDLRIGQVCLHEFELECF